MAINNNLKREKNFLEEKESGVNKVKICTDSLKIKQGIDKFKEKTELNPREMLMASFIYPDYLN